MAFGIPDYIFHDFTAVTPEFLQSLGVKLVVCDIDNTIAPYEMPDPDAVIEEWFAKMKAAGIKFVFVTNNTSERADRFNRNLGLTVYPSAKKPLTMSLTRALKDAGLTPKDGAAFGDQIFTDILAGQLRGLKTILVPPIRDRKSLFWRTKRVLERPLVAAYFKKHPDDALHTYWKEKAYFIKESQK